MEILLRITLSLCAFVLVAGTAGVQTDKGFDLRVTSSSPTKRVCFDTKVSAKGTYFIGGPAKFESLPGGNWKFKAIFDGLGMINKFELHPKDEPQKICYSSKWMNTGMYKEFVKDPTQPPRGVLFEDTIPSRKKCFLGMCDYSAPNDNNWVNMMPVGDKLIWVSDTVTMVQMDPETMNCTGVKQWGDDVSFLGHQKPNWTPKGNMAAAGSAHPLFRPGTNDVVEIMSVMPVAIGKHSLDVYTFDASKLGMQNRTLVTSIPADVIQYLHSFGVTPNYVVLPFNMQSKNLGPPHQPFVIGSFFPAWKGVQVVDFKGNVQLFDDMEQFYHVHVANTFENASGITMDLGAYADIPFDRLPVMDIQQSRNKTLRDNSNPRSQMMRFHMNLQTKTTTVEHLTDNKKDYDFVKINPAKNGLPYCIYYAVEWYHDNKSYASMAVMKHNICTGKRIYWSQVDTYMNEPFFIANGNDREEDDGTLVFTANDGQKGNAIFVALDARTFTEIERIDLPTHLPFQAHGQFIPAPQSEVIMV